MVERRVSVVVDGDATGAVSALERVDVAIDDQRNSLSQLKSAASGAHAPLRAAENNLRGYSRQAQSAKMNTANLGAQFNDIGVMLASGQSPLLLALQQGTQVNQVLDTMGGTGASRVRALGAALKSVVSPANLLTVGIIAGGAALVQWAMSAISATEEADNLAASVKDAKDRTEDLNAELRRMRTGATEEELALMDAISAKQEELNKLKETANASRSRRQYEKYIIPNAEKELQALEEQLRKLRAAQEERERYAKTTQKTADAERLLGNQLQEALRTTSETERVAELLRQGITATQIAMLQAAGVDLSQPIDEALLSATKLAEAMGVSLRRFKELRSMSLVEAQGENMPGGFLGPRGQGPGSRDQMGLPEEGEIVNEGTDTTGAGSARTGAGSGGVRQRRLEMLVQSLQTEREILDNWYATNLELLNEANAKELEAIGGHQQAKLRLEEEYQQRLSALRSGYEGDALTRMETFMGDMENSLRSGNEKMMKVAKAFGAAEALINAMRAYNQVIADPSLPWYAKIPAALSVLSAGMGMVNAIKGVSEGGGGGGAAVSGGAATGAGGGGSSAADQYINVSLVGDGPVSMGSVRDFFELINQGIEDGYNIKGINVVS